MRENINLKVPIIFILIFFILSFVGQFFLYIKKNIIYGLIFFGLGLISLIITELISKPEKDIFSGFFDENKENTPDKPSFFELFIFLTIIVISVFFRFYKIDQIPIGLHRDETAFAYDAMKIMKGENTLGTGTSLPIYVRSVADNPALNVYALTAWFKIFGVGVTEARTAMGFLGVLGVIALYFLLRLIGGIQTAIIGAFLYSYFYYNVVFNRIMFHAGIASLYLIICLYFFFRLFKYMAWSDFILFGITLGLTQHTYYASRAIPVIFGIILIYLLIIRKSYITKNIKKLTVSVLIAFLIFAPLGLYFIQYKNFSHRIIGHFLFNKNNIDTEVQKAIAQKRADLMKNKKNITDNIKLTLPDKILLYLKIYMDSAKKTLLIYNLYGDYGFGIYNSNAMPMAGFITGVFIITGIGYFAFRAITGSVFAGIIMIMFLGFAHGGIMFVDAPHASRTILAMPIAIIIAAFLLSRVYIHLRNQFQQKTNVFLIILFFIMITVDMVDNYYKYFFVYGKDPSKWISTEAWRRKSAEKLIELQKIEEKRGKKIVAVLPYEFMLPDFELIYEKVKNKVAQRFIIGKTFPAPVNTDADYYIYMMPAFWEVSILSAFQKVYPNGEYIPVYKPYTDNELGFIIYKVSKEEIQSFDTAKLKNGLRFVAYNKNGEKTADRIDPVIFYDWFDPGFEAGEFYASWTGSINIDRTGIYTFYIQAMGHQIYELYIDDEKLISNKPEYRAWRGETTINLKEGLHKIKITYSGLDRGYFYFQMKNPRNNYDQLVPHEMLVPF